MLTITIYTLYLFPALIAWLRNTNSFVGILIFNVFLGWTGIGWVLALVWATIAEKKKTVFP